MSSSTDAMSALWGTDSSKPAAEKKAAAPKSSAKPKPAAEKKAAAPKSSAKPKPAAKTAKPKPEPKPAKRKPVKKAASSKPADHSALEGVSNFNGLRGAKLETFGKASKSAMMRVAAEFQAAATKKAKRDGLTLVEITRDLVKHIK